MNAKKSIREIAEEMNAEAKKKGMHLDRDPWSIPADPNFDIFDRLTPEEEAVRARLRRERLARREAAKRAAEHVQEVQDEIREDVRDQIGEEVTDR
ncbi:MAG: hypothetical protein ACREHD_18680 [Pirellulales bacterium]